MHFSLASFILSCFWFFVEAHAISIGFMYLHIGMSYTCLNCLNFWIVLRVYKIWRVDRVGKSSYLLREMNNRHCGYEVCIDEHTFCRWFFLLVATEVYPACLTSSYISNHGILLCDSVTSNVIWYAMLSIWFLWSLVRLDTLILNQNSFGCEGVGNLCEELAKFGAQNRILVQDSRYSRYSRYSAHIFINEEKGWHVSPVFWACFGDVLDKLCVFFVGTNH